MLGELGRAEIDQILRTQAVGRIGCSSAGRTYIVPVAFVYDGLAIYFHTLDGLRLQMMRLNPKVCFEVDVIVDLANWKSVIVQGTFEELSGPEASKGLEVVLTGLLPFVSGETTTPTGRKMASGLSVCRINVTEVTGRFEAYDSTRPSAGLSD
jgi:nitroimidazol reductase NimA-like FMN-containing flavoprotein (pyridoxamine 5'-phosphate oxidase superfamily)